MRLLQTLTLATTMLVATASAGLCSYENGSRLLQFCVDGEGKDSTADAPFGLCHGYIMAIADVSNCGDNVYGYSWKQQGGVSANQLVKVVTKWLNEHPEKLHFGAGGLVANALQDAFPCP